MIRFCRVNQRAYPQAMQLTEYFEYDSLTALAPSSPGDVSSEDLNGPGDVFSISGVAYDRGMTCEVCWPIPSNIMSRQSWEHVERMRMMDEGFKETSPSSWSYRCVLRGPRRRSLGPQRTAVVRGSGTVVAAGLSADCDWTFFDRIMSLCTSVQKSA